jgi:serine/threonine protein kinase
MISTVQHRRQTRDYNRPPAGGEEVLLSYHGKEQKKRLSPWLWIVDSRVYHRSPKQIYTGTAICVAIAVSMLLIVTWTGPSTTLRNTKKPSMITFAVAGLQLKGRPLFRQLSSDFEMDLKPDFGGIVYEPSSERKKLHHPNHRATSIDSQRYELYRSELISSMNKEKISKEFYFTEDLEDEEQTCRRVNWVSNTYPNCNAVHELASLFDTEKEHQEYNVTYLKYVFFTCGIQLGLYLLDSLVCSRMCCYSFSYYSSGCYRDAFRYDRTGAEEFVLKRMRLKDKFVWNFKDLARIQREAIIMEKLSASPHILDMYSHCGTSVLLEAMAGDIDSKIIPGSGYASKKKLAALDDVYPANNFTALEKLQISLAMAESLADIHGYKGGEIVHEDVYPEQWLIARDGSVKLNDFNNAGITLWNDKKQAYCTRFANYGGIVSPNEFDAR